MPSCCRAKNAENNRTPIACSVASMRLPRLSVTTILGLAASSCRLSFDADPVEIIVSSDGFDGSSLASVRPLYGQGFHPATSEAVLVFA